MLGSRLQPSVFLLRYCLSIQKEQYTQVEMHLNMPAVYQGFLFTLGYSPPLLLLPVSEDESKLETTMCGGTQLALCIDVLGQ